MLVNKYTVLAAALVLIVSFQNCSNNASFDAAGSLIAKSGVDDVTGNIDVPADIPADVGNNDGAVLPLPPPSAPPPSPGAPPPSYPPVVDRDHDHDHDHDNDVDDDDDKECANRGPRNGGNRPDERSDDDDHKKNPTSSALVACILEGPGSSVKVALNRAGLSGQNSASDSVCMSEKACLTVVSKILPVKSAEKRGYCDNNPNVVSMTDAEVEAAVNQELLAKMVSSR